MLNQTIAGEINGIDCIESQKPLKISYVKGSAIPVPGGASAKTFLAFNPDVNFDDFLTAPPLIKHTAKTIIDRKYLAEG